MTWRYSLRWKLPSPCPGVEVLASEQVEEGQPAPASVMDLWVAGAGYAVCLDFCGDKPIRRWSEEQKAAARRRNLAKRVYRTAPLFADELGNGANLLIWCMMVFLRCSRGFHLHQLSLLLSY